MAKYRIRAWTTSFHRVVYTAEYKRFFFWSLVGSVDSREGALRLIERHKANKAKEGIEYVN